jgi:hypothetical protein
MAKELKAFYLNPATGVAEACTVADDLHSWYDLLDCRLVEIHTIALGHANARRLSVILDEEGTFTDDPRISAVDELGRPMFVGSLLLVGKPDSKGDLTSLTDADVKRIKRFVGTFPTRRHPEGNTMLCGVFFC